MNVVPVMSTESCAKSIVRSVVRGERYVTEPAWFRVTQMWKMFCPEVIEWVYRLMYISEHGEHPTEAFGKKMLDYTGAKSVLYPESVHVPEAKTD